MPTHRHRLPSHRNLVAARRARAGFSFVELLVACLVLTGGILALARTTASVITLESVAHRRMLAAEMLHARLESIRAARCRVVAGRDSAPGIVSRWSVDSAGGVGVITDTAEVAQSPSGPPLPVLVRSAVPC